MIYLNYRNPLEKRGVEIDLLMAFYWIEQFVLFYMSINNFEFI